jgi:integrase
MRRSHGSGHLYIEKLARSMLAKGSAAKTVRNVMTFLHSVFVLAMRNGWTTVNPVVDAARPKRRRAGDANPDLQFLTMRELDAVIATIPDLVVDRDVFGPVLRVIILTAGTTSIGQSELLGLRWRDVDMAAQRIRVRNAWVRLDVVEDRACRIGRQLVEKWRCGARLDERLRRALEDDVRRPGHDR